MNKSPLSVIIATRNEESNIVDCLKSVEWVDEIIVVDGDSSDRTCELASAHTSHIIRTETGPAEVLRLKGLEHISNPWFLLLDADERVTDALKDRISQVLDASDSQSAYYVLRHNLYKNKPVHLHSPDYQMRLFRKDALIYLPDKIHRLPEVQGEVGYLKEPLNHYFFTTVHTYLEKLNRYTRLEADYLKNSGAPDSFGKVFFRLWIKPAGRFIQYYFFKKGIWDGFFGLFFCLSSAYYEWAVAAKYYLDDPSAEQKNAQAREKLDSTQEIH